MRANGYNKKWRLENPEKLKLQQRRQKLKRYGLTESSYYAMLSAQNYACAICELAPLTVRRLSVDHNHRTGKIRGLLCNRCNLSIGKFNDDPALLFSAANYLL